MSPDSLTRWWASLSPVERDIEYALTNTNTTQCRANAPFDHIEDHTFDYVASWIGRNQSDIREVADDLKVSPALVAGIIASEMLFDYSTRDRLSDISGRMGIGISVAGGYGFSNAHLSTRELAYQYVHTQNLADPSFVINSYMIGNNHNAILWLTGDYGAIVTTAVIARWLVDPYTNNINQQYNAPMSLTPQAMAIIFTAYRAGIGGWSPDADVYAFSSVEEFRNRISEPGLPCNAQLALPLMRYTQSLF
jgi:hypothetical protein